MGEMSRFLQNKTPPRSAELCKLFKIFGKSRIFRSAIGERSVGVFSLPIPLIFGCKPPIFPPLTSIGGKRRAVRADDVV